VRSMFRTVALSCITGANGGTVSVDCSGRRWSGKPRDHHHVFSTTPTPMTSPPPTTPRDFVVTSSAAARRSLDDDGHVTHGEDGDWSRRMTPERPPPSYGNKDDGEDANALTKTWREADDLSTVRHWVKYDREEGAGPSIYRELVDDVDDNQDVFDDEVHDDLVRRHHVDRPSDDAVVHVHHVHEVDDHEVSLVDVEAARRSAATATVGVDDGLEPGSQRPSGDDDEPPRSDDDRTGAGGARKYNVEEGSTTSTRSLRAHTQSSLFCSVHTSSSI